MAGILERFKDIMAANINALLDKAEDPEIMIDQYVRNMEADLRTVKSETAAVMAEETGAKRKVAECEAEIAKMAEYAKKALQAGNEADAKAFLVKKEGLTGQLASLQKSQDIAAANATKMKQMHDKLNDDIQALVARKDEIKTKLKVAKTSQKISEATSISGATGNISAFESMEDKANKMIDQADALIELNTKPGDEVADLAAKYDEAAVASASSVDEELAKLKAELGQ